MEGKEIKMMSMIINHNIERDIITDEKINIMTKNLGQDSVPEECYKILRVFNDLATCILVSLGSYIDNQIAIEEAIDDILEVVNKIPRKEEK